MELEIVVRKMTAAEIEPVTSIYAEVLHPGYLSFGDLADGKAEGPGQVSDHAIDIFREQLVVLIESERHGFFVAIAGETIVGFSLASLHQTEAGHLACWLNDLGIRRAWQGKGVGKVLLTQTMDWGRQAHASYFLGEANLKNKPMHHMVESLGFQPLAIVFWHDGTEQEHQEDP